MARRKSFEELYPDLSLDLSHHDGLRKLLIFWSQQLCKPLPFDAEYPRVESGHRFSQIGIALEERLFMFDLWQDGVCLGNGQTKTPEAVVSVLHHFAVEGESFFNLKHEFSWLELEEDIEVYLSGPQAFVEHRWNQLNNAMRHDSFRESIYPVFVEARQHPRLSQLFPYTSMWSLCFSSCTGYPYNRPCPSIQPIQEQNVPQRWTVGDWNMDGENVLFEGNAQEVVEFTAAQLPIGCGPARHGTAEDE